MPVRKDRHGMPDSLKRPVNGREAALQALLQIWQEGCCRFGRKEPILPLR